MTQPEPERQPGNGAGPDPDGPPGETTPHEAGPAGTGAPEGATGGAGAAGGGPGAGPAGAAESAAQAVPPMPKPGRRGMDSWQIWLRWADELASGHVPDVPIPAWLRTTRGEARWPITITIAAAIVLQVLLPPKFTEPLPDWLLPALEGVMLVGVTVADPVRVQRGGTAMRTATIVQIFLVTLANAVSAVLLIRAILDGQAGSSATPLFATGASVWGTNVIAFGLWYWEFDRGGPIRRSAGVRRFPDLMFPQMAAPYLAPRDWEPHFVDYLYLSFTNATAFSPTDVMPLSRWAKLTMAVQSAVSLAIGALVIARAVNILRT